MKTVAIIILVLALVVAHICCIIRASELKKRKEILDFKEGRLSEEHRLYLNNMAALQAKEESANKKQKDADDAWQKCLEEGQKLVERKNALEEAYTKFQQATKDKEVELMKWEADLADRLADIEAKERSLGLTEVPDIIEPVDEPVKPAFGSVEVKRCPRCGKDMEMKTDVCYTSIPPQYKYICPECGYEKVDTCPPTHNLVGTDKKAAKKARRAKK